MGNDCDHVALEVQNVIEDLVVVFDCIGLSGIVIDEVHDVVLAAGSPGLAYDLTILGNVVIGYAVNGLAIPNTGKVIGVADNMAALGGFCQLPPVGPAQVPVAGTIVPDGRVANGIVGDGLAIVSSQQIQPLAVTIGVGVGRCTADTADVAVGVVGVVIGSAGVDFLGQLPLLVVRVGSILIRPSSTGNCRNVAALSVCVAELKAREIGAAVALYIVNGSNLSGLVAAVGAAGGLGLRYQHVHTALV